MSFRTMAILLMICVPFSSANAQSKYANWTVNDEKDYSEAFTGNDSGSVFGVLCGTVCTSYVDLQTVCEQDHRYTAMINSKAGAFSIELTCYELDKRYILLFDDDISGAIKSGGEIGFAIPLESGRFSVSRFSLEGAITAIGISAQKAVNRAQSGLRDFSL